MIEVYDGISSDDRLLARVSMKNGTLPQSVTTTKQNLYIKFEAEPRTNMIAFIRLTSGYSEFLPFERFSKEKLKKMSLKRIKKRLITFFFCYQGKCTI